MKLILSRKGFDSSAGGCPNPIFPDGSLLALPIPDKRSRIPYQAIQHHFEGKDSSLNVGDLVHQLTKGKVKRKDGAHLDPDLHTLAYSRESDWRPVLGQSGAAQGHLAKQGVAVGDVFLYFGVFRPVELHKEGRKKPVWRFVPGSRSVHCLWGWMQVGEVLAIPDGRLESDEYAWLSYHPHVHGQADANNHLYLSSLDVLSLNESLNNQLPGQGVFKGFNDALQLSDPDSHKPTQWRLPRFFYPFKHSSNEQSERSPLSYHTKAERWTAPQPHSDDCGLQAAARGQEFVLDLDQYPEAKAWLRQLIENHG